jgi:hypothetical protein
VKARSVQLELFASNFFGLQLNVNTQMILCSPETFRPSYICIFGYWWPFTFRTESCVGGDTVLCNVGRYALPAGLVITDAGGWNSCRSVQFTPQLTKGYYYTPVFLVNFSYAVLATDSGPSIKVKEVKLYRNRLRRPMGL